VSYVTPIVRLLKSMCQSLDNKQRASVTLAILNNNNNNNNLTLGSLNSRELISILTIKKKKQYLYLHCRSYLF